MSLAIPHQAAGRPGAAILARWLNHERDFGRLTFFLPVLLAVGVAISVALPFNPSPAVLGAIALAALCLRAAAVRISALLPVAAPAAVAAALTLGAFAVTVQATYFGTATLSRPASAAITGRIVSAERLSPGRQRIVVALESADIREPLPHRVRLTVRGGEALNVGERIAAGARLFPLRGPVMPGGYDAGRRLYFDRIGASGFTYGPPEVLAPARVGAASLIHRLREGVAARIEAAMPAETAAFATALLVGFRAQMDGADVEALRASGLGHILAISGLHMALVAGSVFAAVRFGLALVPAIALAYPIRKWAAVAGILAATFYLALSGGSVATVRAYIMLVIALIAVLSDRPALTMRTVAIAATVLIAMDPISVTEPSFQMSFLAVIALIGAFEWWTGNRARFGARRKAPIAAFVIGLLATSFIAGMATAPAAVFHFHRVAPLGMVANGLAMPVFTFAAMPAGVIALALMPLGLEGLPLFVMHHALTAVLWVAHQCADWSGSSGLVGAIPAASALLCAGGVLVLAILTAPWRLAGAGAIALGLALAPFGERPDIFVSDDASVVAARGPDGRLAIIGRADAFAAEAWLKADGDAGPAPALATCDDEGCTLPLAGGGRLAAPKTLRAAHEDCALAAVVVTPQSLARCGGIPAIDRNALREGGGVTLTRTPDGWRLRPAWPHGPVRPWQVPPTVRP